MFRNLFKKVKFGQTTKNTPILKKLETLTKRLNNIGIVIELVANYPWIYLDKVCKKKVKETFKANHGFTVAYVPIRPEQELEFTDIPKLFSIIRKYTKH